MLQRLLNVLPVLWSNRISLIGTPLTTIAANVILIFFVFDVVSGVNNPYAQTLACLVMPMLPYVRRQAISLLRDSQVVPECVFRSPTRPKP